MLFNSLAFLVFFAAFLAPYFLLRGRARTAFLLAASYVFYGWWDGRFLALILWTTTADWLAARMMEDAPARRRLALACSLGSNFAILGFFKYFNFFAESAERLAVLAGVSLEAPAWSLALPVGISFYTFQSASYAVDVFRGHVPAERSWLRYAAYVAFFPQLVAGPIERAASLLPQFRRDYVFEHARFVSGFSLALWGFVKKLVVADSLGALADERFKIPAMSTPLDLYLGLVFYAFQIYCDFSGYSDIARGTARILGFELRLNFHFPYFAASFREFWTRWHISLSTWLRDYLYVPLGGRDRPVAALLITMLLGGLWHGAKWTFVFWGLLHALYILAERAAGAKISRVASPLPAWARLLAARLVVFHLVCLAWLFFRAPSFGRAAEYLRGLAAWEPENALRVTLGVLTAKAILLVAALLAAEAFAARNDVEGMLARHPSWRYLALAAGLWAIFFLGNFDAQRFIYFQF